LNCHCLLGSESERKLLSSTEMMSASSFRNYARRRLIQSRLSLNVGSLYLRFAFYSAPNLR
jgi:hypothetical protein